MPATHDPIERLAAADPLPQVEQLTPEQQREAELLLGQLIAEPPRAPTPRRRRRVPRLALAGAAAAGAVALGTVSLLDGDSGRPGVAERAAAAVTDSDAIFHIVQTTRATRMERGRLRGRGREAGYLEAWYAPDGSVHNKVFENSHGRRGKLLGEMAGRLHPKPGGKFGGPLVIYDARENVIRHTRFGRPGRIRGATFDPSADPGRSLRSLEAQGRLRVEGTERVGGKDAYRLVSGWGPGLGRGSEGRYEYLVDSETYYPLALRYETRVGKHGYRFDVRFLVYERLPFDARHRRLLDLDPHPGAPELNRNGKPVRD